jgi:hypothetical protein
MLPRQLVDDMQKRLIMLLISSLMIQGEPEFTKNKSAQWHLAREATNEPVSSADGPPRYCILSVPSSRDELYSLR